MKLLPMLLLQAVTAAGAVIVYDQLQDESRPAVAPAPRVESAAGSDFDRRLAALESQRVPTLTSNAPDAALLERVELLERALKKSPARPTAAPVTEEVSDALAPQKEAPALPAAEPSPAELRRFRLLREAARREDAREKHRERIDRLLAKADILLSARQRERVHAAYTAFQPRVGEIWAVAKEEAQATIAAGGHVDRGEVVTNTRALIEQEFAAELEGTIPSAEAESVAHALMSGGK